MATLRSRLYHQLAPEAWEKAGLSPFNLTILIVVLLSILAAVVQSEPTVGGAHPTVFLLLNMLFAALFSAEYAVRLWAVGASADRKGVHGAFRYALTIPNLIDLLAIVALWLDVLLGIPGANGVILRLVRVIRVLTLTRHSGTGYAIRLLGNAIRSRAVELSLSFGLAGLVLLVTSALLYAVEGETQPEAFGSIPRAMWWAVATLTTVGYGDVYPYTAVGKVLAGVTAITSIALVALPAGIMAAAFSHAFQDVRRRARSHEEKRGVEHGGGHDEHH